MFYFFFILIKSCKSPPTCPGHSISEYSVLVSFNHLGNHWASRAFDLAILIVIFHFYFRIRHFFALNFHNPLKTFPVQRPYGRVKGTISVFSPTSLSQPTSRPRAFTITLV